jgi:eukaryotic-like serine/threonine-protein kinase
MSLAPGSRVGSYEVVSTLGSGGMGDVYRATDTRLGRDVAIKVLPASLAQDPERLARFDREARTLASLNHPHIAQIYGVEESGATRALVMELVGGETLADRISRGPVPLDDTLAIARQIADALMAAHDLGIVHRDLKPANVKMTDSGIVKVLDFGLAKAIEPPGAGSGTSMLTTVTSPAMTQAGIILGTAAYMAPEQARGKSVDKRADIWAFGVVLYELVTGIRPFGGDNITDTIAAVVKEQPDLGPVPQPLRRLIIRCLEKDPAKRLRDIGDAWDLLDDRVAVASTAPPRSRALPVLTAAVAAVALLALAVVIILWRPWQSAAPAPLSRFAIVVPQATPLSASVTDRQIDISPDGRHVVYITGATTLGRLMIRDLDQIEPRQLTDFANARCPFFSPDGRWVAFFAGSDLYKVAVTGGPPTLLTRLVTNTRGGTWSSDGTIVIATSDRKTGLLILPDGGGDAKPLTELSDTTTDHLFPSALPDGRGVLYSVRVDDAEGRIAVRDSATGLSKDVIPAGDQAFYAETGHVVYASGGSLYAVRFDLTRLETIGEPLAMVSNVASRGTGAAEFAISKNGTLVYAPGTADVDAQRSLVWVDRQGAEAPLPMPKRSYFALRLSPDGTRVAVDIRDQERDIWVLDIARETLSRLSFGRGLDTFPVWTPDGRSIVYSRASGGVLLIRAADLSGPEQTRGDGGYLQFAQSFTPDGKQLLVTQQRSSNDLVLLNMEPGGGQTPVVETPFTDGPGDISPDGRWLAYQSNESGQDQVYVRPLNAQSGGRVQVSSTGGTKPVWARNQRELFYIDGAGALTAAPVSITGSFIAGTPTTITSTRYFSATQARSYDVTPDGRRFLFIKGAPSAQNPSVTPVSLVVTLNWLDELREKLPR